MRWRLVDRVVAASPCAVKMWAKGGRLPWFWPAALRRLFEYSSAFVAGGNLLDEIDDAAPQFRIFDPHEGFGQSEAVGGRQEVGNVSRRGRFGQAFMAARGLCAGRAFKEKSDRDLENVRNLLKTTRADPVGALLVFLNLLESQTERVAELLLAHSQHHPAHANPASDMLVGWVGRLFC